MPESTKASAGAEATSSAPPAPPAAAVPAAPADAEVTETPDAPATVYVARRGFLHRFETQLLRFVEGDEIDPNVAEKLRALGAPIKAVPADQ